MSDVEPFKSGEVSRFQSPSQSEKFKEETKNDVVVNVAEEKKMDEENASVDMIERKKESNPGKSAKEKETVSGNSMKDKRSKTAQEKEKKDVKSRKEKEKTVANTPRIGGTMLSEEDNDVLAHLVLTLGGYTLVQGNAAKEVDILVTGRSARSIKVVFLSFRYM